MVRPRLALVGRSLQCDSSGILDQWRAYLLACYGEQGLERIDTDLRRGLSLVEAEGREIDRDDDFETLEKVALEAERFLQNTRGWTATTPDEIEEFVLDLDEDWTEEFQLLRMDRGTDRAAFEGVLAAMSTLRAGRLP